MLKLHWFNSVEYNCCITTKADQIKSVEFEHYGHATEDDLLQHIGLNAQQMISMLISIIIIIINIIIIKKELIIVMHHKVAEAACEGLVTSLTLHQYSPLTAV